MEVRCDALGVLARSPPRATAAHAGSGRRLDRRPDPSNQNLIYQRFQRRIMHYVVGQGTRGILLAGYLKAVILRPDQTAQ